MNAINTALYLTLSGDATLTALLSSSSAVYHLQAKAGVDFPYIVFNKQSGAEANESLHRVHDLIYQVRAFTKQSAKAALAIDARIDTLLHGATLNITGYALLKINRVGDIETVPSEPNMDVVYSAGGLYRIRVEKTS